MTNQFLNTLNLLIPKLETATVYVAISGGIDSMVLTELCLANQIKPHLLHCNFNLRGKESDEDQLFIEAFARANQLEYTIKHFETDQIANEKGITIQECARNLRYDWFKSFLVNRQAVLFTAHHLNDSIETFFINTLRGTGIKGLKGIPQQRGQIIRPLLTVTKQEILLFAEKNNISYRNDSSNESDKYLRNKIRHYIVPEMEQLSDNYSKKMQTLLNELQDADDFLDDYVLKFKKKEFLTNHEITKVNINSLLELPTVIITKIFSGFGITRASTSQIQKLIQAQSGANISTEYYRFVKNRDQIHIAPLTSPIDFKASVTLSAKNIETPYGNLKFEIMPNSGQLDFSSHVAYFDLETFSFPLEVSNHFKGKKISPLGMKGRKLISDILIDNKLSVFDKERQLILTSGNNVLWVVNICINELNKINPNTKRILKVVYTE